MLLVDLIVKGFLTNFTECIYCFSIETKNRECKVGFTRLNSKKKAEIVKI